MPQGFPVRRKGHDLAERARLLVNGLTGMADPTRDYETFQCLHLDTNPACYSLNCAGPCVGKPLASLAMARRISGSAQNLDYDEKMIEVVVKDIDEDGYEYARHFGIRRLGFFPAVVGPVEKMRQHNRQRYGGPGQVCETCGIGDMAYIAVKLSEAGIGDYWEDVDGYVRNQLMEHQLTRREGLEEIIAAAEPYQTNPEIHCTENVIDRALGSFLTVSDPTLLHPWFTTCCPGNATSGMSAVWEATVRCRDNVAQVNLLLNRASHWLDVESHLPYEGKVVIRNKTANRIHVRIPVWVDRKAVRCQVNARDISNTWLVNYLVIEPVQPRDVVTITFPMSETVERFTLPDYEMTYTCRFKGNTCVDISPRPDTFNWSLMDADDEAHIKVNKGIDLYQRDSMKADRAPTKRVVRYIHPW